MGRRNFGYVNAGNKAPVISGGGGGGGFAPANLVNNDFEGSSLTGSLGVLNNPFSPTYGSFVSSVGHGTVYQLQFPVATPGDGIDRAAYYTPAVPISAFGYELWSSFYININTVANQVWSDNRKIQDYLGDRCQMVLHARSGVLKMAIVDTIDGVSPIEAHDKTVGYTLTRDTWELIETRMIMNSANNVRDGVCEVYINESVTPTMRIDSTTPRTGSGATGNGICWLNTVVANNNFQFMGIGYQLTIDVVNPVGYTDIRQYDKIRYSTVRIGG